MIKLYNENKYLDTDLIEQCFTKGGTNFIDKVVTGNGFTTGFSYLKPAFRKVNVLIAPNKSVVTDKEQEHIKGKFAPSKRVAFVYEGSGLRGSANDYDLIVLVADSFVNFAYKLQGKVDKLMIDEFHSVIIQSAFRYKLKKMMYALKEDFKDCSISYVTASPLLYSKIDIQIINKYTPKKNLHTSCNVNDSILRCVESIKQGKKVLLFAQDSAIVKRILREAKRNDFKLIAGVNFTTTLLSKEVYKLNPNSNIIIGSSASFEGWSDYSIDGDIYLYMNLGNTNNTFLGCNIYQAIGRLREGYNYAEACVTDLAGGGFPNQLIDNLDDKINRFIDCEEVSIERKQSKNYSFHYKGGYVTTKDLSKFVYFRRDKNNYTLHKYQPAIDVHNEIKQIDTRLKLYTSYFNDRNITLIDIDIDITKKRLTTRLKREQRVSNLCENIRENNLQDIFMSFFFKSFNPENKAQYYIEEIDIMQEVAYNLGVEIDNKFEVLKQYLSNGYFNELKDLFIESKKRKGWGREKIREGLQQFKETEYNYTIDVAVGIVFDYFESNIVGHRDYNKLTLIGFSSIKFIADKLGLTVTEIDVKNCFPRIIYALNGLELPNDFYGEDRSKNKKRVNTVLNSFRLDKKKFRTEARQRADSRNNLNKIGLDEGVVDWLMLNHFNSEFKSDFFNYLAYHERCIVGAAMDLISVSDPDLKMYRRHDSFIVFDEVNYRGLNEFTYYNQKGWFNSYKINNEDDSFLF